MATDVTPDLVRARWPFLSTAVASDALLTILISEADSTVPATAFLYFGTSSDGLGGRDQAIRHLAAHVAQRTVAASSEEGLNLGPVLSASFVQRSETRGSVAGAQGSLTVTEADLATTAPGMAFLIMSRNTDPTGGGIVAGASSDYTFGII